MKIHRQPKICKECKKSFSCPLRNERAYSISSKEWEEKIYCSNKCATPDRSKKSGMAHRGKCSELKLRHIMKLAEFHTGKKRSEETKQKIALAHLGKKQNYPAWNKGKKLPQFSNEKHWNWKGGITPIKKSMRQWIAYRAWRRLIFERDNYRCVDCGFNGYIEAHHIVPLKEALGRAFDLTNGITLCRPCHIKTMGKESLFAKRYFAMIFQ